MIKAISLFSGGLDSYLAAKVLLEQGLEVMPVYFSTPFESLKAIAGKQEFLEKSRRRLGVPVKEVFLGQEYIDMVKHPRHGYGSAFNPCIDCKIFMLSTARRMMLETGAKLVATGEVLGQRPMSQQMDTLRLIEKEAGLEGILLRPLCARLMEETEPEKNGWVKREQLYAMYGRGRKDQLALAEKFGITEYFAPAGGCMLTEADCGRKLKFLADAEGLTVIDAALLKCCRLFRISSTSRLYVGRNEFSNQTVNRLASNGDCHLICVGDPGPEGLLKGVFDDNDIALACRIIARYADTKKELLMSVRVMPDMPRMVRAEALSSQESEKYLV
jgi:tRNA-uridine 2-sulfurtransferase